MVHMNTPIGSKSQARTKFPRRKRRGLINILLSVIIVVVLIVGVLAVFNSVRANVTNQRLTLFIQTLVPEIRAAYAAEGSFGTTNADLVPTLIGRGSVPSDFVQGTTIKNPFSSTAPITSSSHLSGTNFRIEIPATTEAACRSILESLIGNAGVQAGFVGARVGSNATVSAPLTQTKITGQCTADGQDMLLVF